MKVSSSIKLASIEFKNYQNFQSQNIFINKMIVPSAQQLTSYRQQSHLCQIGNFRYCDKDVIGEGFSSKVYKGINLLTNKQVAIKIINTAILDEPINVTLLEFQLQILQKMKGCPYILQLHSVIKKDKDTYIITQVCFTDISKLVTPLLPINIVQLYTEQLIQGFYQIFRKDIIHRDLKPANLLIDCEGNLKIADFGFAIKASQARKQTKFNIGSPLYMSPQALKRNEYSFKSDIWSIGVSVFEMLTGDTPWNAENQQQLYQKYENIRIEQILQKQNFPPLLHNLLAKTLQFDRRFRISPEQLFLLKVKQQEVGEQKQVKPVEIVPHNEYFVTRVQKVTKTQKFQKTSKNDTAAIHKTAKSTRDEPSTVSIRPILRRPAINDHKTEDSRNKTVLNVEQQGGEKQQSCIDTKDSNTIGVQKQKVQKLTKQDIKDITKRLVYCIHICRLLYKILVRIDECIQNGKNTIIVEALSTTKEDIVKAYCSIIVTHMHRIKNVANNNFLQLSKKHLDEYILSSEHKKLKKICGQYIEKYSKSSELSQLWIRRQQPDYSKAVTQTVKLIQNLWPELCQKNHEQIILLQFLVFAKEVIGVLEQPKQMGVPTNEIENYVDTIPNPPSMNRFKQAIVKAKKICNENEGMDKKTEVSSWKK